MGACSPLLAIAIQSLTERGLTRYLTKATVRKLLMSFMSWRGRR